MSSTVKKPRAPRRVSEVPSFKFAFAHPGLNDKVLVIRRSQTASTQQPQSPIAAPTQTRKRKEAAGSDESVRKRRKLKWNTANVKDVRDRFKEFVDSTEEEEPENNEYQRIPVSSILLAAYSLVFKAMFSHTMLEAAEGHIIIEVDSRSEAKAMSQIIEFCYTGQYDAQLPIKDKIELFLMANRYEVSLLIQKCCDDFKCILSEELSAFFITLREKLELNPVCQSLADTALQFLVLQYANFDKDWHSSDRFLQLDFTVVHALLKSSSLSVKNENSVFQAVYRWLTESKECQEQHKSNFFVGSHLTKAKALVQCVRLTELTQPFVVDVVLYHPLSKCIDNFEDMKIALLLHMQPSSRRETFKQLLGHYPKRDPLCLLFDSAATIDPPKPKRGRKPKELKEQSKDAKDGKEPKDTIVPIAPSTELTENGIEVRDGEHPVTYWADGYCFTLFMQDKNRVEITVDSGRTGLQKDFLIHCCVTIDGQQRETHVFKSNQTQVVCEVHQLEQPLHTVDISVDRGL